ncbi:DNA repair protein complementing XP-A cells homolog isoform X2 [Paramacrobiotus metropolitanus]|uniref:DNA repair protein complementing XP-A cells homolog isoform X2 n=1 Tax=Paramacrobiotus metropolitanus TaxID=2943436 RepID=UPI0024456ADC|nr:DNA repair protein complementing XP-A cells homolog isoform X2 [Paramacrobiotus metropolitanus]
MSKSTASSSAAPGYNDIPDFPDWEEDDADDSATQPAEQDIEPPRGFTPPPAETEDAEGSTSETQWNPVEVDGGGFFSANDDYNVCDECERPFVDSWLRKNFQCKVCDDCRDRDGKHSLVTKTDAKNEYLLKDEDFDKREPHLKCITKKNPHNANWGNMKLFLRCQVEERALEVWGTEEALDAEREKRQNRKEKSKKRTFDKMIKEPTSWKLLVFSGRFTGMFFALES